MTPEIHERLLEIAEENAEDLYETFGAEGNWVTEDQVPSKPTDFEDEEYEELFGSERLEQIKNGQPPTEDEMLKLREARAQKMLGDDGDADVVPSCCFAEVEDEDGNSGIALILCTGYSFSELNIWAVDVFETKTAAYAHLRENGWMS